MFEASSPGISWNNNLWNILLEDNISTYYVTTTSAQEILWASDNKMDVDGFKPVRHRRQGRRTDVEPYEEPNTDVLMDVGAMGVGSATDVEFKPVNASSATVKRQARRIPVPRHRYNPLKTSWVTIIEPLVQNMNLEVRMNTKRGCVEIRTSSATKDITALQKAADYIRAFMLGFDVGDAIALLRLDDLFVESFEIKDVKVLHGDHMSRCIGRINGKDGKTKHAIENSTRTRICVADRYIHILGSFQNVKLARDAICNLILGSPPGKVYNRLRTISQRISERY